MKYILSAILTSVLLIQNSWGQSPGSTIVASSPAGSVPLPPHLIYRHFLAWVKDLEKKSEPSWQQGDYKFAEPFASAAGLGTAHVDAIVKEAKALDADLQTHDAKASALRDRYRADARLALHQGQPLPAAPQGLAELQQERDTLIKSHVSILRAALGPEASRRLDQYITRYIAPHINLKAIAVPHMRPAPDELGPFPQ